MIIEIDRSGVLPAEEITANALGNAAVLALKNIDARIFDVRGRAICSITGREEALTVDNNRLPKGTYIIRYRQARGMYMRRFTVSR